MPQIIREFAPSDRYRYDCGPCSYKNGFAQVDTQQDASYYGTWANPTRRVVVNYCEGDVTTTICDNDEEFVAELRSMAAWNDEHGWGPMKIDPGFGADMKAAFEKLGLADLLH